MFVNCTILNALKVPLCGNVIQRQIIKKLKNHNNS